MTSLLSNEERATRGAFAAALLTEMRTPLARVELAADQLLRDAATPTVGRLAQRVNESVLQMDALVSRAVELLVPAAEKARPSEALAPAFESLGTRLRPVSETLGIEWRPAPAGLGQIDGDVRTLERGVLLALRAARRLANEYTGLVIEALVERSRCAIALSWPEADGPPVSYGGPDSMGPLSPGLWCELEQASLRLGGELVQRRRGARQQLLIWLDSRDEMGLGASDAGTLTE